ncbi:glycosyltransferase family 2 protein [Lutimonas vermicola]|uniref:Glycosyltransferase family 2 protein n=1 Tax=Lutimonas vermicola TaxID=414288 RepID=A0ABU9L297_9FLAO
MMKDLVVVLLLNYNQNDYTLKCIESLLESEYENFKIMLIDNGSTPENADQLEKNLPVDNKLLYHRIVDNIGYGKGSNFGLNKGLELDPKYYLIMNNDTIIDKYAISEMVKTSKEFNDKALVTGKVYHYDKPEVLQFVGFKCINKRSLSFIRMGVDEKDEGQYDKVVESDMIDDIFVLHSVDIYKEIGGYSPYFWINGVNIDRALRAMEKGFKLIYTPKAILWHKGSVSIGGRNKNPKIAFWNIQSKLMIRYLHLNRARFVESYLRIFFSDVMRTYIKSKYLKLFKGVDITAYANNKLRAVFYFNRWMVKKNHNTGFCPK